jgi:hypothetical protein
MSLFYLKMESLRYRCAKILVEESRKFLEHNDDNNNNDNKTGSTIITCQLKND